MSSNLRIGGLASGMDIDQIVSDLMKVERMKVDKLEQEKQILEWKQEDYREINNKIRALRDAAFEMKLQGSYLKNTASSSNESVLTASASGNAVEGTYTVVVDQLASGAFTSSSSEIGISDTSATIETLFGYTSDFQITINSGEKTATIDIDVDADTINTVVSKINNWKDSDGKSLGVKAVYDENLDRFFLQTTKTGADQMIDLSANAGDGRDFLENKLMLTDAALYDGTGVKGQNAKIKLNGAPADPDYYEYSSNTVDVLGMTLNLSGTGSTTVTVTQDTDAVFDSIVRFINTYNETAKAIADELYEERYSDYLPLTDEQREQLTDSQIEKWEEKARSGLLRRDPLLTNILNKLRMTMSAVVPGVDSTEGYDRLADIGIKTTQNYMSPELVIDEGKLREALQNDLEGVMSLFTKSADDYSQMGIAQRVYEDAKGGNELLIEKAGSDSDFSLVDNSFIGKEIKGIDEEIEKWEDRLQQIEDRYWRQFTAMEKAIQQMNQQSMWLMQQFGGGM